MKRKFLSILLVLAMIISIAPVSVFATNQVQWKGSMNYGDANNMVRGIGDKTPVSKDYTEESWYTVADSKGYPSTQVIIGDYIYCYNGKLVKYDLNGNNVVLLMIFGATTNSISKPSTMAILLSIVTITVVSPFIIVTVFVT